MKKIICIVGLPGSGKSTIADILAKKLKTKVVHSGDVIRDEIKRRGLPYTPENDRKIAAWFHSGREKLLVKRSLNKIGKIRKNIVVLEGFRAINSIKILEEMTKIKPIIVSVEVPFKIRLKRELERGRFGKLETVAYLWQRDKIEKKRGVKKLMKMADFRIDNSKKLKDTVAQIDKMLKKIQ